MAGNFNKNLTLGKKAEMFAEKYFQKQGIDYKDVRDCPEHRKIDVDYITDKYGKVEVKCNYADAKYGRKGKYFWVELEVGDNKGWWYFCETDHYFFNDIESRGIIIENSDAFKAFVNHRIEHGDHSKSGKNRIDEVKDERYGGYITVVNMRVYFSDLDVAGIPYVNLIKRKKPQ